MVAGMPIHLECLSDPARGKHLPLSPAKPISIKTNKGEQEVGEVRIEQVDGTCVLTNRSKLNCTVNGIARARTALVDGDVIQIGKQSFRLVIGDDDGVSTQQMLPQQQRTAIAEAAAKAPQYCSACDSAFGKLDREQGWVDGDRRICRSCLAKGVRPDNLPRTGAADPVEEAKTTPTRRSPEAGQAGSSDSDRQRRQRRLSASRLAKVDESAARPTGLLSKVGAVFGNNREERRRLELLEQERSALLLEAGRVALTDPGYGGLPEHCLAPILKGVAINVRLQDLNIAALERWRGQRERLSFLDAEIAGLRAGLSLGPDPAVKPGIEPLRGEQIARQNRTFATLDAVATQDLDDGGEGDGDAHSGSTTRAEPAVPDRSPAASARRKAAARRKR